jgi:hypothetical protein
MKCKICFEPFDRSIHNKSYSLSLCPQHTYCLKCLQSKEYQLCPECREPIKGKNINIALLEVVPESSYDKLKAITLNHCIEINEINNNSKKSNEEKLSIHEKDLKSIKQTINDETNKIINILKQNEIILCNECDIMLNDVKSNLNLNKFEIDDSIIEIEKDELNEIQLSNLNTKIDEIKNNINNNSKKIENKILNNDLLIDQLKKVI